MTKVFIETGSKNNEYFFIKDLISHYCGKKEGFDYIIITVGGKDNLDSQKNQFFDHEDKTEKNLVIFDADFPSTDDTGGYENRSSFILKKIREWGAGDKTSLFLFPNNKDNGAFENLLEKIVQPEHNCILEYFKEYEQKLESCKDSEGLCKYNTPDQKARIYAYAVAVKKRSNTENESFKKGNWSFLDSKYWNLESDYIRPLKDFLIKAFE